MLICQYPAAHPPSSSRMVADGLQLWCSLLRMQDCCYPGTPNDNPAIVFKAGSHKQVQECAAVVILSFSIPFHSLEVNWLVALCVRASSLRRQFRTSSHHPFLANLRSTLPGTKLFIPRVKAFFLLNFMFWARNEFCYICLFLPGR